MLTSTVAAIQPICSSMRSVRQWESPLTHNRVGNHQILSFPSRLASGQSNETEGHSQTYLQVQVLSATGDGKT